MRSLALDLGYDFENLTDDQVATLGRYGAPAPSPRPPAETAPDMGMPDGLRAFIKEDEGFLEKWQLDRAKPNEYVSGGWGETRPKIGDGVAQLEKLNREETDWERMFEYRIAEKQDAIRDLLGKDAEGNDKWDSFTPRQQGALTSLVYNIGQGAFSEKDNKDKTGKIPTNLITALKNGDLVRAGREWLDFNHIGTDVSPHLTDRRWTEVVNFLGDRIYELTNVPPEYRERLPSRNP